MRAFTIGGNSRLIRRTNSYKSGSSQGDYGVTLYLFTHIRRCLGSLRVLSLKHLSMSQSIDKGLWYSFCLTDRNPQNFSQDQKDLKKFISANRIDAWNWKILGEHKITAVLNPQGKKKGEETGQNKALGTNLLYRHTSSLEKRQMTDRSEEERAEADQPKPWWIVPE